MFLLICPISMDYNNPTELPRIINHSALISFWDFQEEAGQDRVAKGPHLYRLMEMSGPIQRVDDGVRGPYAAQFDLRIWNSADQVGGHVSSSGGSTPGHPWCMTTAIGATLVPKAGWHQKYSKSL